MASISNSLCNSSLLPMLIPCSRLSLHRQANRASTTTTILSSASRNDNYGGGRIVDENLIVLRKRIHEMKMIESDHEPPSHWMNWEKNCYAGKDEFICDLMGLLQTQLMNTRPCLILALIVIVSLSVPASAAMVCFQMMQLTKGIFTGLRM